METSGLILGIRNSIAVNSTSPKNSITSSDELYHFFAKETVCLSRRNLVLVIKKENGIKGKLK